MNRTELDRFITGAYGVDGEYPWMQYPAYKVFRHRENRKWFAVLMDIPAQKLGIPEDREVSIVNLKCDTRLISTFRDEPGIYPAYHMSKAHWLTVVLDGATNQAHLQFLLDMSYELTK